MNTNPVGWFEIPVADLARAKKFYEAVFGFELTPGNVIGFEMAFFPRQEGVHGATGALVTGEGYTPSRTGTIVYFPVPDIEAALLKVEQSGGKKVFPKTAIGEHGFIGWFEDSEGNTVALHCMT